MLGTSIFRIPGLHHSNGCSTLTTAYVGKLYLENHWGTVHLRVRTLSRAYVGYLYLYNQWVSLHLWVSTLKCSLILLGLNTKSVDHTTLMGAPP